MNIIFLFSGNTRTSPFSLIHEKRNYSILDSYNNYIFTDEFKQKYNYKIYFTVDDLHLSDTIEYFKLNNIGNIHLLDTGYYLNPINSNIEHVEYFIEKYNNHNFNNCIKNHLLLYYLS